MPCFSSIELTLLCNLEQNTRLYTASACFQLLGWTRENLKDWGQFARVICANVAMNFILWLAFELGTILAGEYCIFNISIVRLKHYVVSRCLTI